MSLPPLVRDNDGSKPLIAPHILQFILQAPQPPAPPKENKEQP